MATVALVPMFGQVGHPLLFVLLAAAVVAAILDLVRDSDIWQTR